MDYFLSTINDCQILDNNIDNDHKHNDIVVVIKLAPPL
jgi:hypothetical protein